MRTRRRFRGANFSLARSRDDDGEITSVGFEDSSEAPGPPQSEETAGVSTRNTPMELLALASKPTTLFQKAIDRYWEEFEKDILAMPSKQAQQAATSSSWPTVATVMQLLQLLTELANDPNIDSELTVLEAWKESQVYGNETVKRGSNSLADSVHESNSTAVQRKFDAVNRTKWMASWNEGLTNEDMRDVGDHIWRYLIGGR